MITVIISTYNRHSSLRATLESLARMIVPPQIEWELIVVDNNSQDQTREVVEELARTSGLKLRYVFEPRQGQSFAINTGVGEATGDIIALTDDDVIVDKKWLHEVKKAFDEFDCVAVAGRVIPAWKHPKPSWLTESGRYALPRGPIVAFDLGEEPCLVRTSPAGANLSFKKAAFGKYGLFRTDLGSSSAFRPASMLRVFGSVCTPAAGGLILGDPYIVSRGADSEFCARLTSRGEAVMYCPNAVVYHPVERSRSRKGYYRGWCFDIGRYDARMSKVPPKSVRYFGVPRYLFRSLFEHLLRWILTVQSKRRFYYELKVCRLAGHIFETRLARMKNQ